MLNLKSFSLGASLALYASSPAWALDIADVPLFQSTTVAPNVMMLLDNSGSMRHIIWQEGYDTGFNYFSNGGIGKVEYYNNSFLDLSLESGNYVAKSDLKQGGCSSGWDNFRVDGSVLKCLKLPDPVGDEDTWFVQNYLAYLVRKYPDGTDLSTLPAVPNDFRLNVLKSASKSIVASNPGMRFGMFTFNGRVGGELKAAVGSSVATLNTQIDALGSSSSTPLAEAYYEVTRYFRGLSKASGQSGTYTSPQQYRCQKNFGIVVTDGLPTYDTDFPADDPDAGSALPDWDGVGAGQAEGVQYSDGPGGSEGDEGSFLYMDDMAKFAHDIDFIKTGNDASGVSYNDPAFTKQNLLTYTVGFSKSMQMLEDAAAYGKGQYFTANNANQLNNVLTQALQSIKGRTSSAAAIATNSTRLDTDTLIYQAKFNSSDWSGELLAYGINANGSVADVEWRTSTSGRIPAAASRNIFTRNATGGTAFQWANLSPAQQTELSAPSAADGSTIVDWLRGGSSGATLSNGEVLRSRTTVLGDIINSDPVYVGAQNYGYTVPNDPAVATEPADTYQAYLDEKSSSGSTKLLLVGANDGMVHGFNAETGSELFAYVPTSLFKPRTNVPGATPGLRYLTKANYSHKYYVDGSIGVGDVYSGGAWKTYAVGGLGAGGRGLYALDVTSPASFSASKALWEITAPDTATTSDNWNDLGYTYGLPVIARTQDDTWVAIFGNGYGSNTGSAALYIVNAITGAFIKKIVVDTDLTADVDNGLSAPAVVVDANRRVTYVYAGDLKGNLWKFDLNSAGSANWGPYKTSGNNASKISVPLFTAKNSSSQVQPITSGLEIGSHPTDGGLIVYFGTGKYFETSDNVVGNNPQMQSFYGIWDKPVTGNSLNGWEISSRSNLQQQRITFQNADYRVFSDSPLNWADKRGWYMDLASPSAYNAAGERSVSLPLLRAGRIIFTTVIPSTDPCLAGGTSWLMEVNAFTGGNLNYSVLDINGDGEFNDADKIACGAGLLCNVGGKRSPEGIIKTPGIVSAGDTEYKYSGGSSGNILVVQEKGSTKEGRMSWRQLR